VDTTAPDLVGMPSDVSLWTNDPSGTTLTYSPPTATDIADPSPTVVCLPASGSTIPVGTTTVTCTATDAAGNHASKSFMATVALNTKPTLLLPSNRTVEATSPAGAVATFAATATDAEDATAPTPTCSPASGSTFALGTTTVNCTVTDGGGLSDSGSFQVKVVDTTAPSLAGMPSDVTLTTADPSGATLTYAPPTATDAVDPSPSVVCSPASGSTIPVGTTTVTCTATDATGNHASKTFKATVTFVSSVTWTAIWGEPVGMSGDTLVANAGRTVPIKVEMFANGVERTSGRAEVSVVACGGGATTTQALSWENGRWTGHLDTSGLAPGCYVVTASLNGNAAGSFQLDLRGSAPAPASSGPKAAPTQDPKGKGKP
ncbi:MAG TPA: HYR domain-containing protein, partial [Candidatus Limnocylindrales bacterium]